MAKGFDLSNYDKLASEDGVWMHLLDPATHEPVYNDQDKAVRIQLLGIDSQKYRSKQNEIMNRRLKRGKINLGTAEQLAAERVEILTAITVGWEGFIRDGKEWPFSPENVRTLYSSDQWKWIREQVDEFSAERSNFLQS